MIKEAQIVEAVEVMPGDEVMASELDLPMDEVIVTEELPIVVKDDAPKVFDWKGNKDFSLFMDHIRTQVEKVPSHSGQSSLGCHRAIQYLKAKKKELTDAFGEDFDCKIDEKKAEELLKDINKKIKELGKRQDKIHEAYDNDGAYTSASVESTLVKNADDAWKCPECGKLVTPGDEEHKTRHNVMEHGKTASTACDACNVEMVKSAEDEFCCVSCEKKVKAASLTKEAGTAGFALMITPLERAMAGMIINGTVSNGKNPEAIYEHIKEKYKLTPREELSLQQVLADMGYPFIKDRGLIGEKDENPLGKGVELATNYWA